MGGDGGASAGLMFKEVGPGVRSCPVCRRTHWCAVADGEFGPVVNCMWAASKGGGLPFESVPAGMKLLKATKGGGYLYVPAASDPGPGKTPEELRAQREKAERWKHASQKMAKDLWRRARQSLGHARVRAYLEARGIPVAALPGGVVPRALGFVAGTAYGEVEVEGRKVKASAPAMVAAVVEGGATGRVVAIHRTYLDPGGAARKFAPPGGGSPKKMLGPCTGAAVRLGDVGGESGPVLLFAEGIETALACSAACGTPAWALLSCKHMQAFHLDPELVAPLGPVAVVVIAADLNEPPKRAPGDGGVGERSARLLANTLRAEFPGLTVEVRPPTAAAAPSLVEERDGVNWPAGDRDAVDWLDVLNAHGAEAVRGALLGGIDVTAALERAKGTPHAVRREERGASGDGDGGTRTDDALVGDGGGGGDDGEDRVRPWSLPRPEDRPILEDDPLTRARRWLWEHARVRGTRRFTVARWADAWWIWRGGRYAKLADERMASLVWQWLAKFSRVRRLKSGREVVALNPEMKHVSTVLEAMKVEASVGSVSQMPARLPPNLDGEGRPMWGHTSGLSMLDVRERADDPAGAISAAKGGEFAGKVVLIDGILDINEVARTNRVVLHPHTPEMFTATCLPFRLPAAELQRALDGGEQDEALQSLCPCFWGWLAEASDGDPAWERQCQEMVGDTISNDRTIEKIYMPVGLQRSGKGLLADVVTGLVGEENVVKPMLSSLATDRFAPAAWVGKSVAYIPDGNLPQFEAGAAITEFLKSVRGNDSITIRDLHQRSQTVKLNTRIWISCNLEPDLRDESSAFADSLVILPMRVSAEGRENPELKASVPRELPGILVWALLGAIRLARMERRRISVCQDGREIAEAFKEDSAHVQTWRDQCLERCEVGRETPDELHATYVHWCKSDFGRDHPFSKRKFFRALAWLTGKRYAMPRGDDGQRDRIKVGWRLNDRWRSWLVSRPAVSDATATIDFPT